MIQEHAKEVTEKLGKSEFKASNGWLESFRKRHQIMFNKVCGESGDVCGETVADWVTKLPSIIDGYKPKNIANGDEMGLFFRAFVKDFWWKTLQRKVNSFPLWFYDWRD
jgi:hypothetical protein